MNSLFVLLAIQTIFSVLLVGWVRLRVERSLNNEDAIAKIRRELGALIVELDGSADRNITVIEDRLRELKDCIAEADKRIVMLSNENARTTASLSAQTQMMRRTDFPVDTVARKDEPETFKTTETKVSAYRHLASAQKSSIPTDGANFLTPDLPSTLAATPSPAPRASTSPTPSVPFIRFSEKPLVFEEPFAERVMRLYRRGFSSDIIAAKLKVTIAEVDLALATGNTLAEDRGED